MNILIVISTLLLCPANHVDTSGIYQLQFKNIEGNNIDMSSYKGKQIILYEFNAANPDRDQMIELDSLFKSKSNLMVIAIPVKDFSGTSVSIASLNALLKDSLQLSYPVADLSMAGKTAAAQQHTLLDWVTHVEKNEHFNDDIDDEGYMFVISNTGILYSIMKKEINPTGSVMQEVLSNGPLQ